VKESLLARLGACKQNAQARVGRCCLAMLPLVALNGRLELSFRSPGDPDGGDALTLRQTGLARRIGALRDVLLLVTQAWSDPNETCVRSVSSSPCLA